MPELEAGEKVDVDRAKVAAYLNERWKGPKLCPICRENTWLIGNNIVAGIPYIHRGVSIGGPTYPLVVVTCQNCGHTLLFNALVMGLFPKDEPQKSSEENEGRNKDD